MDTYINACAAMYQEALEIRKQYESIDTLTINIGEAAALANNGGEVFKEKKAEYERLLERIKAQEAAATKLPALAEAAVNSVPVGLKAISITKAIASTKDAVKLAAEENVALMQAITKQLTSLSTTPTVQEQAE